MDFVCSDERITNAGLANPGSVLFDLVILKVDPAKLVAKYRHAGVTIIYSHDECGAAKVALGRADASWDEVNAWAQSETKKFCDANGFEYGHIRASELVPQGHGHPGTTLYVSDVLEHRGGYRVSPLVSSDTGVAVKALLELVAFKPGNGGDQIRTRNDGSLFHILVEEVDFTLPTIDQSVASFVKVEKVQ